nr:MAG TPA: hypothetical protein [Caudoviricetes sp.]
MRFVLKRRNVSFCGLYNLGCPTQYGGNFYP